MQMATRTTRHSQLKDVGTPHVGADLTEAYIKVAETTISGGAVASISFTGLDLETDETYLIFLMLNNAIAGAKGLYMEVNGDTTDTNYYNQTLIKSDTTNAGGRSNNPQCGFFESSDYYHAHVFLHKLAGHNPWCNYVGTYNTASTINVWNGAWVHNNTTNVTTLQILGDGTDCIANGSKVIIYKLK